MHKVQKNVPLRVRSCILRHVGVSVSISKHLNLYCLVQNKNICYYCILLSCSTYTSCKKAS
jgi:hypothetical protein